MSAESDEQLRRESPAYRPGDPWEELEPQSMQAVFSVRFDARSARRIVQTARKLGQSPSRLIRDWTLDRLESHDERGAIATSIREAAGAYETASVNYEELRYRYRPKRIKVLLVGEARPAGGTFFYLANSKLFYATHEAFQVAFGPMPAGEGFLHLLRDQGVWLFDLADHPVDRLPGRPRRSAVRERVDQLIALLRETGPERIVAIKRDLAPAVRLAIEEADLQVDRLTVLPFPLYQWRAEYIRSLASIVGGVLTPPRIEENWHEPDSRPSAGGGFPSALDLLSSLVGHELHTLTGSPNLILRLRGDRAIVATNRSPQGKPVPVEEIQYALDELERTGDLLIDVPTVGHRSAFVGAVLRTLPGTVTSTKPRRIRVVADPPSS